MGASVMVVHASADASRSRTCIWWARRDGPESDKGRIWRSGPWPRDCTTRRRSEITETEPYVCVLSAVNTRETRRRSRGVRGRAISDGSAPRRAGYVRNYVRIPVISSDSRYVHITRINVMR